MLQALADGETSPTALAALADERLRATPEQLCDALGACTELNAVYRRLLKMALEELRLSGLGAADHCRSRPNRSDLSLREMSLLVGRCLPGRRRECRGELQPPLPEGQPPHAALTQSGCERRSQGQRKHLRNCVSPLRPAPRTQSSHRGHRPSTVSTDLVDPTRASPLRRTGPSRHQTIKAKAYRTNHPATPKPRLSDRSTESSTQPGTSAVIFEPEALTFMPASVFCCHPDRGDGASQPTRSGRIVIRSCRRDQQTHLRESRVLIVARLLIPDH
jgi:hypothetical protein